MVKFWPNFGLYPPIIQIFLAHISFNRYGCGNLKNKKHDAAGSGMGTVLKVLRNILMWAGDLPILPYFIPINNEYANAMALEIAGVCGPLACAYRNLTKEKSNGF